jgi:hypothetical protein
MSQRKPPVPKTRGFAVPSLVSLAKALAEFIASVTLYAAPCLSAGALVAAVYHAIKLDLMTGFSIGFFIPLGPVYLMYASGWGMRRTLTQIKDWEDAGLIDHLRAEKLRDKAVDWFIARRF